MKIILSLFLFTIVFNLTTFSQRKTEDLTINWPAEYKWKVANEKREKDKQVVVIIPGNEKLKKASILGVMVSYPNLKYSNIDEIIRNYRMRIDTGTTLTVLETDDKSKSLWAIFKVETPKTDKYPVPESDLYYVIQGEYGFYEIYVAIKSAFLSNEFINKWTEIFKEGKLMIE